MKPELEIEVLKRSAPPGGLDSDLRLTPPEWRLFTAADGKVSLADLARRLDLSGEAISLLAEKLKAAGLLAPADYTSAEFHELFSSAAEAAPPANQASTSAAEAAPRKFSASLKRRVPGASIVPMNGVASSTPPANGRSEPMSLERDPRITATLTRRESFHLRPLIDFIVSTAGGAQKANWRSIVCFAKFPMSYSSSPASPH